MPCDGSYLHNCKKVTISTLVMAIMSNKFPKLVRLEALWVGCFGVLHLGVFHLASH